VHRALRAGARGFLLKDAGPALLTRAIHPSADGDALIAREEEVLIPVARGQTNHEIADRLHISQSTVKTHLASLMRKLGARNRVELATWAYETGRMKN
jgi:DNA-binding NarL/FixJ family response regulator